jgi:DNA helicase IV
VLPTNCRNTRRIARACGEIIEAAIDVHEDAPEGDAPLYAVASGEADVVRRAEKQIQDWCLKKRGGLAWDRVAVLTPLEPGKEWPEKFGNIPLTRHFERWREGKGVLLSTHRRFKGLEADALILAGVSKPGVKDYFSRADYYVACSRAKHLLSVISVG